MYLILSVLMWAGFFLLRSGYARHLSFAHYEQEKDIEFWLAAIGQGASVLTIAKPGLREVLIGVVLLLQVGRWWAILSGTQAAAKRRRKELADRARLVETSPEERYPQLIAWQEGDILVNAAELVYLFVRVTRDYEVYASPETSSFSAQLDRMVSLPESYTVSLSDWQRQRARAFDLVDVMDRWTNKSLLRREPSRDPNAQYWKGLQLKQESYRQVRDEDGAGWRNAGS